MADSSPEASNDTDGVRRVMIPLSDGTRLAVTLFLPPADALPTPCVLEALPYRKDDLTATYRPEYVRLRDEHGYAVARLDLRGTGSSDGLAVDEYPAQEQRDLCEVIAWLADQQWCTGAVGMYGTSYSGFNSLQVACERPPQLKAIIAIYATDDRYTDDVHLMGGARRLLDLVDYPTYMVAINALPPVPSLVGDEWVDTWRTRVEDLQPWVLRWLEEQRDSPYWRHGSLRPGYDRIECPTMLVGGWADGYRNNTFRTVAALAAAGVPHRLLIGPWSHMSTENSLPGPHIDLVPVMARWWDRWLRGQAHDTYGQDINGRDIDGNDTEGRDIDDEPAMTWYQQHSTRPGAARRQVDGEWRSAPAWPLDGAAIDVRSLGEGVLTYDVLPDVGTSAWNSCAASLPWGQPTDQRFDDAASLTWSWPADGLTLLGHPRLRLRVASSAPIAFVSAKLTEVFPDGTSSLLTRGLLNLTHRSSSTDPSPLPIDEFLDIEVELEAMAWTASPGHELRLSLAGVDWPNTLAPPEPLTLTIDAGASSIELPLAGESTPTTDPLILWTPTHHPDGVSGAGASTKASAGDGEAGDGVAASDPAEGVTWRVERDVLGHRTECVVDHGSAYDVEGGAVVEHYAGRVWVDTESFAQGAESSADFTVRWPEGTARARAELSWAAGPKAYDVVLTVETWRDGEPFAERRWEKTIDRDLT